MKKLFLIFFAMGFTARADDGALAKFQSSIGAVKDGKVYDTGNLTPDKHVDRTVLGGKCEYQGGWCPGAKVTLKDAKNNELYSTMMTSQGFKFSGLTEGIYNLEIEYDKFNKMATIPNISSGKIVSISFDDKK